MADVKFVGSQEVVSIIWEENGKYSYKFRDMVDRDQVYVMVLNYQQKIIYDCLMKVPGLKVLFQSAPAINTIHPQEPRSFVLVFEFENQV